MNNREIQKLKAIKLSHPNGYTGLEYYYIKLMRKYVQELQEELFMAARW